MRAKVKSLFYNLILAGAVLLLTVLTAMGSTAVQSMALEQQARCGLEEHTHTQECYLGDVLRCQRKAHEHSQNCYLVLLEDNDINWLLAAMGETATKSLEGVIDSAMGQALVLNDSFAEETPPLELTQQDITSLNQTIEDNHIEPAVVLNENLQAGTMLNYLPQAYGEFHTGTLLALTDTPQTGTRGVNFYILLDGKVTFIGSGTLTNSSPDYYSYSNIVKEYTDATITGLTTSNINSSYFFYYNTTGTVSSASSFSTGASYQSSRVRMGNVNNARYVILKKNAQTTIEFFTVTLDYSQSGTNRSTQTVYVESGRSSGLELSEEFAWYDANGDPVTALPSAITATTTLYARPPAITVTFTAEDGGQLHPPVSGKPTNGSLAVTLPALTGEYAGWLWIEKGSDGTVFYPTDGTSRVTVSADTEYTAIPGSYTVTLNDENGRTTEYTVGYRERFPLPTLPDGWMWVTPAGVKYTPGDSLPPITEPWQLSAAEKVIQVYYDVNFPGSWWEHVDTVPTLYGTTQTTQLSMSLGGRPLVVQDLTSRTARREINSGNKESLTCYFKGWTVEGTNVLIPPDTTITWAELQTYLVGDNVSFKGVWEEGNRYNSVSFFVRFDSAAVDTNGNITSQPSENYTPEVFNTYLGGVDTSKTDQQLRAAHEIADTTSDNSFGADQAIRALYGEKTGDIWLYDFPNDNDVFAYLKQYLAQNPGKQLTVEGQVVDPNQLNHSYYAIRWYVFKLEGSSWHVDGKLVKKEGTITVDKLFGGDDTVLQTEKDGFYILAENGALNGNGEFVPYDKNHTDFKQYLLVVNQASANALRKQYPNAQVLIFDSETDNEHYYEWLITEIRLGEYWHIEEFPVDIPGYSCYAEYSVFDTDGEHSAIAEYGTRASVVGKTFALDEDPDQGLMVQFRNYYYPKETILIKKEDGKTGKPVGGAVFELWQNGKQMSFNYNEATGQYERDESGNGTFSRIVTSADGYSVISTTGFSYGYGDVVIREVLPPAGYDPAPDITIGTDDTGQVIVKDIAEKPPDQWDEIAEVPDNDVLVVKDYAAEFISVTAEKIWNTNTPADSVEVVLQANGQHAAALFPGMSNAQVVLNAGNLWRHTWSDLPRYANGQIVQWGIKEVLVGGKPTLSDGVTFANWTVTYSPGIGTDTDGDGDVDNWKFTVTNTTRRLQLILTKVGSDGALLPGTIFSLEQVEFRDGGWQPIPDVPVNVQTTDANGMLTFDNLSVDVYYRLAELQSAEGYYAVARTAVLTMDGDGNIRRLLDDGTIAQLYDPVIQITGPYNIRVTNLKLSLLPDTGGVGATVYRQGGLLLMAAALVLLYKRKRRREEENTS